MKAFLISILLLITTSASAIPVTVDFDYRINWTYDYSTYQRRPEHRIGSGSFQLDTEDFIFDGYAIRGGISQIETDIPRTMPFNPVRSNYSIYSGETRFIDINIEHLFGSNMGFNAEGVVLVGQHTPIYPTQTLENFPPEDVLQHVEGLEGSVFRFDQYNRSRRIRLQQDSGFFDRGTATITSVDPVSVPEPATLGIMALGLVGIGAARRFQRRNK